MRARTFVTAILSLAAWGVAATAAWASPARENQIRKKPDEIAALRARAEAGDAAAAEEMGELYYDWAGVTPDYVEAAHWFHKAADEGYNPSFRYGPSHYLDKIETFTTEHAALYAMAQSGDGKALYDFAQHTPHNATGLTGDAPKEHWFLLSARAGYGPGEAAIGSAYFNAYYRRRWDAVADGTVVVGQPFGFDFVGYLGEDGREDDVPLNFEAEASDLDLSNAISWLDKAAQGGNGWAAHELAMAYAVTGDASPGDPVKARDWLYKAANDNSTYAQEACELAFNGELDRMPIAPSGKPLVHFQTQPDYTMAFDCFSRYRDSYEMGSNDEAPYYLGRMYHRGLGVARDDAKALALLQPVADGYGEYHLDAKYELSRIYRDSNTLPHDLEKAYLLLTEASERYGAYPFVNCYVTYSWLLHIDHQAAAVAGLRREWADLSRQLAPHRRQALDRALDARGIRPNGHSTPLQPAFCVD